MLIVIDTKNLEEAKATSGSWYATGWNAALNSVIEAGTPLNEVIENIIKELEKNNIKTNTL